MNEGRNHQRHNQRHDAHKHDHGGGGHHEHHQQMLEDFRRRFWVSLILTLPILALSKMLQGWLGVEQTLAFPGDRYIQFALASAVFVYGGWPFLKGLVDELKKFEPGMMTLIAQGIIRAAEERGIQWDKPSDLQAIAGKGAQAIVNHSTIKVVSPGFLKEHERPADHDEVRKLSEQGKTV